MEELPNNSRKANKEAKEEKVVKSVVTGPVKRQKKPLGRRFMETFVGGEDARSVWSYVLGDVILPAAKDMVSDAVSQAVERMLFGESRPRSTSRTAGRGAPTYSSYSRYSSPGPLQRVGLQDPRPELSHQARAVHRFDDLVLDSKAEATGVLDQLYAILQDYEVVTVADFYESAGLSAKFTDEKWGWKDLGGSEIVRVRQGYLIKLPQPRELD